MPLNPAARTVDRLMTVTAAVLLVLLVLRAALTFDPYYDTVAYHLPFAARLSGICPESCYLMSTYVQAAYEGFPKLFHRLQGLVWRMTGSAQTVDLLNVAALALFCLFLRRWFRVPPAWTFCALVAVPLVQIHATSTYIDLPVNLAAAAAILAFAAFLRDPEGFGRGRLAVLLGCLVLAANSKTQMIGVVAPLGLLFAVAAFVLLARGRRIGPFRPDRRSGWAGLGALLLVAGTLAAAAPIVNMLEHGNPFYPVRLTMLGFAFDGPIDGDRIGPDSLSEAWQPVPSPLRWLASVLEINAYSYRPLPWTYDQGYCPDMIAVRECGRAEGSEWWSGAAYRMGGYFVPYVLALTAFFVWSLGSRERAAQRALPGAVLVGTTLLAAFLPRSHELRYYLFWMIVLVALCLIDAFAQPPADRDTPGAAAAGRPAGAALLGAIVLVALASVLSTTQGRYVTPAAPGLDEAIATLGIDAAVAKVPDGVVVCGDHSGWDPFMYLFARVFHPGRTHTLWDHPPDADCGAKLPRRGA